MTTSPNQHSWGSDKRYASKQELFMAFEPRFNFELDADQLLALALKIGFVKKVGDDKYESNAANEWCSNCNHYECHCYLSDYK